MGHVNIVLLTERTLHFYTKLLEEIEAQNISHINSDCPFQDYSHAGSYT